MSEPKPLIRADGQVRELEEQDLEHARVGNPLSLDGPSKQRVSLMLDHDVHAALKSRGVNIGERINTLLREDLGL
ncbi:MAG: BrnA antitoxin family protein [Pseudomonadota bacterium]